MRRPFAFGYRNAVGAAAELAMAQSYQAGPARAAARAFPAATVITTSRSSTAQSMTATFIACAIADAWPHAAATPSGQLRRGSQRREIGGRLRAVPGDDSRPDVEPADGEGQQHRHHRDGDQRRRARRHPAAGSTAATALAPICDARQQNRARCDRRHDQPAVPANVEARIDGRDVAARLRSRRIVAARREPGRLPGGIDAPHLHRHRGEPGDAQRQNRHQRGDGEGRLDSGSAAITGQTLVLSARLMMFVSALTIESPVTTV